MKTEIYNQLKATAYSLLDSHGMLDKAVTVTARTLKPQEAIGDPDSDDFPIQKGKERLMQAELEGAAGQAFTDHFGGYQGTLSKIFEMHLNNNYRRAIFVAALNAALRCSGAIEGTVHCRDQGPRKCAQALYEHIDNIYGGSLKITQIGFQPRMVEMLAAHFPLRVLDMDSDNIANRKFGITIESPAATEAAVAWADLLLVTGTTLVNGTLPDFLNKKPVIFYGTTIAGAAHLMGLERFCAYST
jgi:hypothetical protein